VRDLWHRYEGEVEALRGVSLAIARGERLAIVGQNGSGKTTLAKHFVGLLRPTRGAVLVDGKDARGRSIGELASRVGYVFQNPDHQIFAATVWEELAFGPRQLGVPKAEVLTRVDEALTFFHLEPYRDEPPAALGFGLRRAIGLAAVLTMRPATLVLDEPFTGLDWAATAVALDWLRTLNQRGHTVVLVTHNMRAVAEFADRALVLADGQVAALGTPRVVFRRADVLERAGLTRPQAAELATRLGPLGLSEDSLTVAEVAADYLEVRRGGAVRRR
jgi:energy-coupling factor transport system ATP-binding protein